VLLVAPLDNGKEEVMIYFVDAETETVQTARTQREEYIDEEERMATRSVVKGEWKGAAAETTPYG
jgi:hypothetical protein